MEKILITGANGFLASRIIECYKNSYEIFAFGKNELNITDYSNVQKKVEEIMPHYIFHTGAIADTQVCEENIDLSYEINVIGTKNIANIAKKVGAKLIFTSSEQVYNGENNTEAPFSEENICTPAFVYGKHKLEAENVIKTIFEDYVILRLTWMFDMPKENCKSSGNILWGTMKRLIKGETIEANANEYRGMTYAKEVVKNFPRILALPKGIYNCGSENDFSRYEILKFLFEKLAVSEKRLIPVEGLAKDIRIKNDKIKKFGINFRETKEGLNQSISDYNIGG